MKRKVLSLCIIVALFVTMLPTAIWATDGDIDDWENVQPPTTEGSWLDEGSYDVSWYIDHENESSYTISDAADLAGVAALSHGVAKNGNKNIREDFSGKTITLDPSGDFDLSGKDWVPINGFSGTFDGSNVSISGLAMTEMSSRTSYAGLFSYVTGGAKLQNITLENVYISVVAKNGSGIAAIAGELRSKSSVSGCKVTGVISVPSGNRESQVGGIVGYMATNSSTQVSDCTMKGRISVGNISNRVGGIVGFSEAGTTIKDCTNNAAIDYQTGGGALGGIVGKANGTISGCENNGALSATNIGQLGGLIGCTDAGVSVTGCENKASVTVNGLNSVGYVGGILGEAATAVATLNDCHNSGAITVKEASSDYSAGGLIGSGQAAIDLCSNSGDLSTEGSKYAKVGGLLGASWNVTIERSYNAGDINLTATGDQSRIYLGGLIGDNLNPTTTVSDCYNVATLTASGSARTTMIGGLLGNVRGQSGTVSLTDCYNAGSLSGENMSTRGAIIGNRESTVTVTQTDCHYWDGCGAAGEGPLTVNQMTDDEAWAVNLGLDESVWEKADNVELTGMLPILKENKQDLAPSMQRTGKIDQQPLSISGGPEEGIIYAGSEEATAGFTLTASGGSTEEAITWTITKGDAIASIDANGQVSIASDAVGEVTIEAKKTGNTTYNDVVQTYTFRVVAEDITEVTIYGLGAPVHGVSSAMTLNVPDNAHYEPMQAVNISGNVFWKTTDNDTYQGVTFEKDTVYTAVFRVQADDEYGFADDVTVHIEGLLPDAYEIVSVEKDKRYADNLQIEVTFTATAHTHGFQTDSEWTSDAMNHWHACKNEGCPLAASGMPGYDSHIDANDDGRCDECAAVVGYTVTFDANGGACDTADVKTDLSGKIDALPEATRSGYTFLGWFTQASGGEKVTVDRVYDADTVLYAHWEKIPYTGTYNYEVTVDQPENGTIVLADEDRYATAGEKITITVQPDEGYVVDDVTVTTKGGKDVAVTDNGDGTYSFTMPSGAVTINATFVEAEEPAPTPETSVLDIFDDLVPGAWYIDAVQYAYDHGLMTGTSATTFSPDQATTRGMIVAILHRQEGEPVVNYLMTFDDVDEGAYYAEAVRWAASEGVVNGYSASAFGPTDAITREQLAAILYNYATYKGMDTSARADLSGYSDAASVSAWAEDAMQWAVDEGLINGMSETTLAPDGNATRAQVAAILQRFLEA